MAEHGQDCERWAREQSYQGTTRGVAGRKTVTAGCGDDGRARREQVVAIRDARMWLKC